VVGFRDVKCRIVSDLINSFFSLRFFGSDFQPDFFFLIGGRR
jgi:hypothetical protein